MMWNSSLIDPPKNHGGEIFPSGKLLENVSSRKHDVSVGNLSKINGLRFFTLRALSLDGLQAAPPGAHLQSL